LKERVQSLNSVRSDLDEWTMREKTFGASDEDFFDRYYHENGESPRESIRRLPNAASLSAARARVDPGTHPDSARFAVCGIF
jgi:hypothetical protein